MLPNYLHIGAAKAASTWIYRAFLEHPEIYAPPSHDNVNFFTVSYQRGLDWYEQTYFADVKNEKAVGEFSNSYHHFLPAMQRVKEHLPNVKLGVVLRNPIERAYLHWAHIHTKKDKKTGKGKMGFDIENGIGIPLQRLVHHHGHSWFGQFLGPGFYNCWLGLLEQYFDSSQIFIALYDDLQSDNAAYLRRYFEFLGVDPDFKSSYVQQYVNPESDKGKEQYGLTPKVRAELQAIYAEDIARLSDQLDRDLSHWK